MSPEQALGQETDYRADIYSLAVVAYSLICGELPFVGKTNELVEFHRSGSPRPPREVTKLPRDVSDAVMAGLARDPGARPPSAQAFTRRFHNAVDAEFFAFRRSKSFLMQRLPMFFLLIMCIYSALLVIVSYTGKWAGKLLPDSVIRLTLVPVVAALLLVFSDNLLRTAAAFMALDERVRVRRFMALRVLWKLVKALPKLAATQAQAMFFFGPGWVTGDALWPVICAVEKVWGKAALVRSRSLMAGLNSAGRALAIRHLALAALAIAELAGQIALVKVATNAKHSGGNSQVVWFPLFALFAAAPLYLYDRTAARAEGQLMRLDRTPEIRTTSRPLSLASIMWIAIGVGYLIYQAWKVFLAK
jgi:hypothetical protein